ncbi:MAG: hypothetical protein QOJ22_629 [Thermoleophilaceae bacterium]|jgi:hypothetical protein|nr:hypothetical protein [Thermoleophilaceae bacterium]
MRGRILVLVAVGAAGFGLAALAEGATKGQIVDRAAEICANGNRAMQPYDDRTKRAADRGDRRAFVRNARRSIRIGRRHLRRLAELRPPRPGRRHYRSFLEHTRTMANWLDAAVDALAAGRDGRAQRRSREAERASARAKAAARRYGLRRACIRYVTVG